MTKEEITPVRKFLDAFGSDIIDLEKGWITCPGSHWHTTPNAPRDCILYHNDDGSWRIHCQHESCKENVNLSNSVLSRITNDRKPIASSRSKHPGGGHIRDEQMRQNRMRRRLQCALLGILKQHQWTYNDILTDSPTTIASHPGQHWRHIIELFNPDDVLWCANELYDSGSDHHRCRFRTAAEWLKQHSCPGSYICPNSFIPGVCSRSRGNILAHRFLVVESDTLDRDQIGAVFQWLVVGIKLRLRAVVDTAGKSLHAWFDYPLASLLAQLKVALPHLNCDPALFNPWQPCRLPGALREGKHQTLIYLDQ